MLRTLATVLIVAGISAWISWGERTAGLTAYATDWVRTADGWESRRVVEPYRPLAPPAVHPGVIAGFQLLASLLVLAAFPASARTAEAPLAKSTPRGHRRQAVRTAARA